jgi:hypothetical protein
MHACAPAELPPREALPSQLLLERVRGEDVVARWGGEEIALALYRMTSADGVRRVSDLLRAVCDEAMVTPEGQPFRVSFSGGVSEYRVDGTTLRDLCRRADEALYVAKALGRERVLPAGRQPELKGADPSVDVVVVEDDDIVAELLAHALSGGGYSSLRVATARLQWSSSPARHNDPRAWSCSTSASRASTASRCPSTCGATAFSKQHGSSC